MRQRPAAFGFPHVWLRFERTMKDGSIRKFKIQDVTEELEDGVMELMLTGFLPEEAVSIAGGSLEKKEWTDRQINYWKHVVLPQRLSLVCVEDVQSTTLIPKVVGANFLVHYDGSEDQSPTEWREPPKILAILEQLDSLLDVYQTFNVTEFLGDSGLSVSKEYRGLNIGKEILLARTPMCTALGYKVTETIFSGIASQVLAEKAGFKTLMEITYSELQEMLKQYDVTFPKELKTLKIMAKTFDIQ